MSKFKVGDKVRLAEDVEGDFASYGVEVGLTGVVNEVVTDDPFGLTVGVTLDIPVGDSQEESELLFHDFELELIS